MLPSSNMYKDGEVESMHVHYAETQAWYYLQDQQASIFRQADSKDASILGKLISGSKPGDHRDAD